MKGYWLSKKFVFLIVLFIFVILPLLAASATVQSDTSPGETGPPVEGEEIFWEFVKDIRVKHKFVYPYRGEDLVLVIRLKSRAAVTLNVDHVTEEVRDCTAGEQEFLLSWHDRWLLLPKLDLEILAENGSTSDRIKGYLTLNTFKPHMLEYYKDGRFLVKGDKESKTARNWGGSIHEIEEMKQMVRLEAEIAPRGTGVDAAGDIDRVNELVVLGNEAAEAKDFRGSLEYLAGALVTLETLDNETYWDEVSALVREIRKEWAQELLTEARSLHDQGKTRPALAKLEEAQSIFFLEEGSGLYARITTGTREKAGKKRPYKSDLAFFIDIGDSAQASVPPLMYWRSNWWYIPRFTDNGNVQFNEDGGSSFRLGVVKMLMPYLGLSFAYSNLKTTISTQSTYNLTWDGETLDQKAWVDRGSIVMQPLDFSLVLSLGKRGEAFRVNLYAGPSLFLTRVALDCRAGFNIKLKLDGMEEAELDWFALQYETVGQRMLIGANLGGELECRVGRHIAAYLGGVYYIVSRDEFDWYMTTRRYNGQFGVFYISEENASQFAQLDDLHRFTSEIEFPNYRVHLGLKLYF